MSSVARKKSCVSRANAKPNHVKKLNFGPSVPNASVAGSSGADVERFESKSKDLLCIGDVAKVSFAGKQDFVRRWIETHDESHLDPIIDDDVGLHQTSPILGLSTAKRVERSPVLGNRKKRMRGKAGLNCSATTDSKVSHASTSDASERYVPGDETPSRNERAKTSDVRGNTYGQMKSFDERCSFVSKNKSASNSVSLDKTYAYKRRKRKFQEEKKEDATSKKSVWTDTKLQEMLNTINDIYTGKMEPYVPVPNKYPRIEEKSIRDENQEGLESICILDINPPPCTQKKLNIIDSPMSTKSSLHLDIESCEGGDHGDYRDKLNISSDSDKTIMNIIEDVDSQDAIQVQEVPSACTSSLLSASSNTLKSSIASTKDSDETFYSKAERITGKLLCTRASQKISQTPPSGSFTQRSSQADIIISLCASPSKVTAEALTLNTLDSGKKRKKPKKGTLADRLQSLISKQTSCIRIWRHQMKNTLIDNTSTQYVIVQVQTCSVHFGRQFLEGFIIKDDHNLLQDYVGTGTLVEANAEEPLVKKSYKSVAIMTVPSIIGTIQMRAEGVIRIYPPWEIMDNARSIISVMYLSIMPPDESNNMLITGTLSKARKPLVVQEFACPCTESGNFLASCEIHKEIDKPSPLMQLFKL